MRLGGSSHPLPAFAFLVSATLASSTAPPAGAQAPPPTFTAETEVVTVDVLVLDQQGKPVSGLGRADFRVLEDGKPQALTAFEAVEAQLPPEPLPGPAASPSPARVVSNVEASPTRRTFGIVLDDLHLDPLQVAPVRQAVEAFLARDSRPGDRLILLTTSDGRFWTTTRGAESESLARALGQVTSKRRQKVGDELRMSPVEAKRILNGDTTVADRVRRRRSILSRQCTWVIDHCECDRSPMPAGADGCQEPPGAESPEEAYQTAVGGTARTLDVLRQAVAMLGAQRDRKALVLVSEGFFMDPSLHGFRDVRDVAARSNVVLYFLDARGLEGTPDILSAASPGAIPPGDISVTLADYRQEADGAKTLAEETGGLTLQTNDFQAALQRVADESRVTYLLGYEPPTSRRDGRYHELKVAVLRPGLRVRGRAGYFAAKGEPTATPEAVQRALQDPFDRGEIPLRLATYVLGPAPAGAGNAADTGKQKIEVVVAGELRQDALESRVVDGGRVAEPRLVLSLGTRDRPLETAELRLKVPLPETTAEQATGGVRWHPFATRVAMEPGEHRVRIVVESGGRTGSLTTDLVVPKPDEERLSTPILSDMPAAEQVTLPLVPIARRNFATADTLHCWVALRAAATAPEDGKPRTSASFRARSVDGREWATGAFDSLPGAQERTEWLVSLPLHAAPAGESELVLSIRDLISGRTFESREVFRVEPRAVPPVAGAAAEARPGEPEPAGAPEPATETRDAKETPLATILERAGAYVSRYGESFRNLVADETYRQVEIGPDGTPHRVCNLRSDVVFVPLPGSIPWGTFRDVYDVDGKAIHDRDRRLEQLFVKPSSSSYEQARAILREGARYNLGEHGMNRTVNVPALGLLFLLPENQARLAFKRRGTKTIAGFRTVEVAFEEKTSPTLVRDHWDSDVAASGSFWIDPAHGSVLQTRIEYDLEKSKQIVDRWAWATGIVVTEFRREPALDIFVPDTMADWYIAQSYKYLEGRARYSRYRRFQVASDWEVTGAAPSAPPQQ